MLKNMEIYRINLLPRSYDERVKTDVHDKGFKLTSNSIGEFGMTDAEFLTQQGKDQLERALQTFETHCEKERKTEIWRIEKKRQILSERVEPRWAYSSNYGRDLGTFVSDPNNLFKKSLLPLDKKQGLIQEDPFKRT